MKLCDRCRVSGCCLNYIGEACKRARKRECPDVVYTNGDKMRDKSNEELAVYFSDMAWSVPSDDPAVWLEWLRKPAEED